VDYIRSVPLDEGAKLRIDARVPHHLGADLPRSHPLELLIVLDIAMHLRTVTLEKRRLRRKHLILATGSPVVVMKHQDPDWIRSRNYHSASRE